MDLTLKICGLSTAATLDAALRAGVDMVGFVFVAKSPRNVTAAVAGELGRQVGAAARKVALIVDPEDAALAAIIAALAPDLLQLHGQEPPQRVADIRRRFGVPVMKAIGVAEPDDLAGIAAYRGVADHILIDAKPPGDAAYPGGHGRPFDWSILAAGRHKLDPALPFMLSGGLHPGNVAEAIRRTRAWGVDVSSGVEAGPGVKDPDKIAAFVSAARDAQRLIP